MTTDLHALISQMAAELAAQPAPVRYDGLPRLADRARALLAQQPASPPCKLPEPEAEGPSASDVTELFYRHMGEGSEVGFENAIAEALSRWGRPTPQPVAEGAPLSLVTNCHISGPAPKPFTHWSDYFNHVQQSGVISGLKIEANLPTPEATND